MSAAAIGRIVRQARFHRVAWSGTLAAIALSVAVCAIVLSLGSTLTSAGEQQLRDAESGIDAVVRGAVLAQSEGGPGESSTLRESLDVALVDEIRGLDGVAAASGDIEQFARLVVDGQLVEPPNVTAFVGRSWIADAGLAEFTLDEGRAPSGGGEVVVDRATADHAGVEIGERIGVLYGSGVIPADVVGIAGFGDVDRSPNTSTVLFDEAQLADSLGQFDRVLVRADGLSEEALIAQLGVLEPVASSGAEVISGSASTAERVEALRGAQVLVRGVLTGAAVLAVAVGALVVASTITITMAQRRRELALSRLVGSERRQIVSSVLGEVGVVAALGAALGVAASVVAFGSTASVLRGLGVDVPTDVSGPGVASLAIAGTVGVVAAVIGSLRPALAASRTAPVESLRSADAHGRQVSVGRSVASAAGLVVGFVAAIVLSGPLSAIGVLVTIASATLLAPAAARVIASTSARMLSRLGGSSVLGLRQVDRDPGRAARASTGLWVGAALLIATAVLSTSLTAAVTSGARSAVLADAIASSADDDNPTITEDALALVAGDDEVTAVSALRLVEVAPAGDSATASDGEALDIGGIDPTTIGSAFDVGVIDGELAALSDGAVAVHESLGLVPGDSVELSFTAGTTEVFPVGAVFTQRFAGFGAPDHLISLDELERAQGPGLYTEAFVTVDDSLSPSEGRDLVAELFGSTVGVVQDASGYGDPAGEIGPVRTLINALAWLAVVIALVGLVSSTVLAVQTRKREIATFRAIGATRGQVWSTVTIESTVVGIVAAVIATVVGLATSALLVDLLGADEAIPWTVAPGPIGIILGTLVVLSTAAAMLPARRATVRSPLEGLRGA